MDNIIEIAEKYFDMSNERKLDLIPNLFHSEIVYSSDNTGLYFGRDNVMEMMTSFFNKFKLLNWKIDSIDRIKDCIVEIRFTLSMVDLTGTKITKEGIERIIIIDNLIRHIEVRNIDR